MTNDLELFKFARLYLGQTNWELIKSTTQKELELFQRNPIDVDKSYLVYGKKDLLNKFRAFYLTRCLKKRPLYDQYQMYDYAHELCSTTKDDYGMNVDLDLVFLYRHEHGLTLGKSEEWLVETTLNKVANRNRDGLSTVILSELKMEVLEKSGELEVINLAGLVTKDIKKKVLDSKRNNTGNTQGTNLTCYD